MSEQGNKGGIACLLKFHILWQAQTDEGKIKGAGGHLRALIPPIQLKPLHIWAYIVLNLDYKLDYTSDYEHTGKGNLW